MLFHTHYNEYFRENVHLFEAIDLLAEITPGCMGERKPQVSDSPAHPS